jgi:hypothetical protein
MLKRVATFIETGGYLYYNQVTENKKLFNPDFLRRLFYAHRSKYS